MDPGVMSHGIKANPPGYLWCKYECFLMSGCLDIPHLRNFNIKLWSNSTNGMEQTDELTNKHTYGRMERQKLYTPRHKCRGYKDENYIPLSINAGGIIMVSIQFSWLWLCPYDQHLYLLFSATTCWWLLIVYIERNLFTLQNTSYTVARYATMLFGHRASYNLRSHWSKYDHRRLQS